MGDTDTGIESTLVANNNLDATILKAGHQEQPSTLSAIVPLKTREPVTPSSDGVLNDHSAYQSKLDRDKDGWTCE